VAENKPEAPRRCPAVLPQLVRQVGAHSGVPPGTGARMTEYRFLELVTGGAANRGRVVKMLDGRAPDYYGKSAPTDATGSAFRFGPDFAEYVRVKKSVRGFDGPCRAPALWWDFDGPTARADARTVAERLLESPHFTAFPDDITVAFSGNKGYHLTIENAETRALPAGPALPATVKRLCCALAAGLPSFDKAIYDKTRIFRVMNSRHGKSGLFKIPLYLSELWSLTIEQIRELAKVQRSLRDPATIRAFLERQGLHVIA